MPSYDVHQHIWPSPLVRALRARRRPPRLDGDLLVLEEGRFHVDLGEHELERRIALLDRDEVDLALVSLPPTLECGRHPELRDAYHEGITELVAAAEGRLAAFADGACLDGFVGACVPAAALVEGLDSLPEELEDAGQVLFVHPGPPGRPPEGAPAWWAPLASYTAQMQTAYLAWLAAWAERHPGLPVIFAILGGGAPIQIERLRSRGIAQESVLRPSVHFETASYGRRALALSVQAYGIEHLVYGSDAPVIDSRPTLQALRDLGEAVETAVRIDNPSRLFA